ncbi:chloride channel protein [Actomonas aquatica]|uniref:Chloride channel protein n=1 Tax=Actomonas aquatica TaxID=2866162 RepID=A0ABZ1C749_9BACT|nr:chloride channel protein [Opitutus sp. WL0086]WRQ87227.1 chloride channel protein [Opitutus sp. WL0086]
MARLPVKTRGIVQTICFGLAAGGAAVAFHIAIHSIYTHGIERLTHESTEVFLVGSFIIIAVFSAISGWLLSAFCPDAAGSGIPQVKLAFWKDMGHIPFRVVWVKFIAGALTVGAGNSLGREGPSVQLAAGLSSQLSGVMGTPKHKRRLANAAGAAAGLAAAFNTPIAAVTFVLEEIIGDLNSRMLGSILLAAVVGALVAHGLLGEQPAFTLRGAGSPEWQVYLATPIVAAIAALAGVWFQKFALGLRAWNKKKHRVPPWLRCTLGGLAVWLIGSTVFLWTNHTGVFGLGYEDLSMALNDQMDWQSAALLLVAKLVATAVCYGLGAAGGIFAPTLFFGGMAGAALAGLIGLVFPLSTAGHVTLAVVGMCACLGAVVRAPVTGLLIVFEMTHEFAMVPALMVGGLVSLAIAKRFTKHNFYDVILEQDGQGVERVMPPRDLRSWQETAVSRAANFRPVMVRDLSRDAVVKLLEEHHHDCFPVVIDRKLQGAITREHLQRIVDFDEAPIIDPVATCRRDATIRDVQSKVIESPANMIVIVGGEDEVVIGIMTLHDILRAEILFTKD